MIPGAGFNDSLRTTTLHKRIAVLARKGAPVAVRPAAGIERRKSKAQDQTRSRVEMLLGNQPLRSRASERRDRTRGSQQTSPPAGAHDDASPTEATLFDTEFPTQKISRESDGPSADRRQPRQATGRARCDGSTAHPSPPPGRLETTPVLRGRCPAARFPG